MSPRYCTVKRNGEMGITDVEAERLNYLTQLTEGEWGYRHLFTDGQEG